MSNRCCCCCWSKDEWMDEIKCKKKKRKKNKTWIWIYNLALFVINSFLFFVLFSLSFDFQLYFLLLILFMSSSLAFRVVFGFAPGSPLMAVEKKSHWHYYCDCFWFQIRMSQCLFLITQYLKSTKNNPTFQFLLNVVLISESCYCRCLPTYLPTSTCTVFRYLFQLSIAWRMTIVFYLAWYNHLEREKDLELVRPSTLLIFFFFSLVS